jgi:hemerythrin-like domain-containing protein
MKPTDILRQEHRVIEQVLDCLERIADEAGRTGRIDESAASDAIDFFRHFADGCHHAKEENQLFSAMETKGFDRQTGPLGVMLYEHTVGREAVRGMEQALDAQRRGEPQAASQFLDHARRYTNVLRQHIEKEDHCLFAMAEQAFSQDEQTELLDRFAQAEQETAGKSKSHYLQVAQSLADRYQVAAGGTARPAPASHACGAPSCEG